MKNQALIAFLGGAIVGAAAALLFAPEKGSVARKKIKKAFKDEKERISDMIDQFKGEVIEGKEKLKAVAAKCKNDELPTEGE